ncbi:MAG: hypothetical protein PHF76_07060 [Bacteroidales bacterium]|nr:hypothetical protein [Bacteroidales bacterium]
MKKDKIDVEKKMTTFENFFINKKIKIFTFYQHDKYLFLFKAG